jgi:hypothetical protein
MNIADISKIIYRNSDIVREKHIQYKTFSNLIGGGSNKLKVIYKDQPQSGDSVLQTHHTYNFIKSEINSDRFILYSQDNKFECISIFISTTENVAKIHGITNFTSCLIDTNENVGSTLLKITLKMLKKYKEKLNINKISVKDNSQKNALTILSIYQKCYFY